MISIYDPSIKKYSSSALRAVESGWISNHGEFIVKSTALLNEKVGSKYCILMANGTCATHCLFLSLKHKHPSIEKIYVPNNAYVAAYNTALMVYPLSQLQVMKMNLSTWNIETDEEYIKTLDTNSAVLIVHNLGNIINVPRLKRLRPDLVFVEDNCEGMFGKYETIYSGTSDDTLCSSASFYGNKIITSGEGGAFLTNHKDVYEHILQVYSQGMSTTRYLHDVHAYNYRMTNIEAAFLNDQLLDIDSILANKRTIFKTYKDLLAPFVQTGKIALFELEKETYAADWIFALRIIGNRYSIEETSAFFKKHSVDIRPFFYPIHHHAHLSSIDNTDESSILLNKEVIMVPSSPEISLEQQTHVVQTIQLFLDTLL